jgi:taurine dioxygenase
VLQFELKALPGGIGAEVLSLDPESLADPQTGAALRAAWLEHGILLFRDMAHSPEDLLALSRCFGELEVHPIPRFRLEGYPELILLTNRDGPTGPVYDFDGVAIHGRIPWHIDLAFTTTPNAGALLRMVQKTEHGGQTGWLDVALAHDALDEDTKVEIAGLEAIYHFASDLDQMRFNRQGGTCLTPKREDYPHFPPVAHPLVWTHPETGRKVLNLSTLNIRGIVGMPQAESDVLIERLLAHAMQPRFQYVHEWQNDDVMLWDNRRTMHCAFGHPVEEVRIVQRSTLRGGVAMGRVLDEAEASPA